MGTSTRRLVSVGLAVGLLAGLFSSATTIAAAPSVAPATWEPCFEDAGEGFECDVVRVPLIHDRPTSRRIGIAMVRLPATDPAHRIGSLFVNPGGPGGSGVDFVVGAGPHLFTPRVRARFDIVGFDPRGIMRSEGLRCFESPKEWGPYFTPFAFPITTRQTDEWKAADTFLNRACDDDADRILDHMSTANTARDLDLLRQAVGDAKLTYYGVSYGTMIGQTYANLYPNRFRALIIDGVLDPIAWTTGSDGQQDMPFSSRLRSDHGAMAALKEFFRLCDEGEGCAFAPDPQQRYKALAERLTERAIIIQAKGDQTFPFIYQDLIAISLGAMYDSSSWPDFAQFLAALEEEAGPAELGVAYTRLKRAVGILGSRDRGTIPSDPDYPNFLEGFPGVACADSDNPESYRRWTIAGANAGEVFGYFGRLWTWASSICAHWPGRDHDRYVGPFDRMTNRPVLVVGTTFDPATRYQGALIAHDLLPNSRLLTVHGWAHGAIFLSECADDVMSDYLIHGTPPPTGTVCEQDVVPFAESRAALPVLAERQAASRLVRGKLIPQVVVRSLD